ncbi:MAG: hypothetical protein ACRYF0_09070 [Janthinobacterium lividum]
MESYTVDKTLWATADFELMGWHDSIIYGLSLINDFETKESELMLDIDYIFQWNNPEPPSTHFTFWVAPCTLVFKNVLNVQLGLDSGSLLSPEMEIADIHQLEEIDRGTQFPKAAKWQIELQNGDFFFEADGFEQYVRRLPSYCEGQQLSLIGRGGISFKKVQATS